MQQAPAAICAHGSAPLADRNELACTFNLKIQALPHYPLAPSPLRECVTLLRDLASLPGISDLCAVDDVEHEDHLFSASATVGLDTWYPGLWGTARKRVRFDVAALARVLVVEALAACPRPRWRAQARGAR